MGYRDAGQLLTQLVHEGLLSEKKSDGYHVNLAREAHDVDGRRYWRCDEAALEKLDQAIIDGTVAALDAAHRVEDVSDCLPPHKLSRRAKRSPVALDGVLISQRHLVLEVVRHDAVGAS